MWLLDCCALSGLYSLTLCSQQGAVGSVPCATGASTFYGSLFFFFFWIVYLKDHPRTCK